MPEISNQPILQPIDFADVAAKAGDLREIVMRDLGYPDRNGKWPCPFHDEQTASFVVYEDHYHCFGCSEHGDAIHWIARRDGLTLIQAAKRIDPSLVIADDLKMMGQIGSTKPEPARQTLPPFVPGRLVSERVERPEIWLDPSWQSKLSMFVRISEDRLWSAAGAPALAWLRQRGLQDHTIERFRLGFNDVARWTDPIPHWIGDKGQPRKLRLERGITIPWAAPGSFYSDADADSDGPSSPRWVGMNVRKLADPVTARLPEGVEKCQAVAGSKRGRLYPWPTIERTQGSLPMLLVEGEFDALIGDQIAGHVVHVGSVGSASISAAHLPTETKAALARCPWIFLALDFDKAGAENVRKWREIYPDKSRRVLLPSGKDLNEFVALGGDLLGWIAKLKADLERHVDHQENHKI